MWDMSRISRCLLGSLYVWLLTGSLGFAQGVSTASIAGTVRDESGGALPGVTVTATQTATGLTRTALSGEAGGYTLQSLPVGPYRLEFALQGFRTVVQTGVVLEVGAKFRDRGWRNHHARPIGQGGQQRRVRVFEIDLERQRIDRFG